MKHHLCIALFFLCVCGCATKQPALSLAHNVDVPKQYLAGSFSEDHPGSSPGNSTIERYINAYERGWVIAVNRYAKDIDFNDPSALAMSGWREEATGGADGYSAARVHIEQLIRVYGKAKVHAYLQQNMVPDGIPLGQTDAFPPEWREAAGAVAASVTEGGEVPGEFYAEVSAEKGTLVFHLWHESAFLPANRGGPGNPGGKCRDVTYDTAARKVASALFWQ